MAILLIAAIAAITLLAGWGISTSNKINKTNVKIDEGKSAVEIQLRQRHDILTQSMDVAKGYLHHEEKMFTSLRAVNAKMSVEEINKTLENQAKAQKELFALAENYPQLRSAELFSNLQKQLSVENAQLSAAKRAFNANVARLNNFVVAFPSSIICKIKGQSKMEFIREDDIDSIKDVKFTF